MDAAAIIALINLIIESGLADKIIALLVRLFDALSEANKSAVANRAAEIFAGKKA